MRSQVQRGPEAAHDLRISGIYVRELLRYGPDELGDVDFRSGQKTDYHAREHRRQHDIAPRILGFFRQRGNPVETNGGQHGDGCASKEATEGKYLRIVNPPDTK